MWAFRGSIRRFVWRALILPTTLSLILALPAEAGLNLINYVSDVSMEGLADKLKPPEGGPPVVVPSTLEGRKDEYRALTAEVAVLADVLAPLEREAFSALPAALAAVKAAHRVPLLDEERKAVLANGPDGLSPDRRAAFAAATRGLSAAEQSLADYLDAYDRLKRAEIKKRILGNGLDGLEKRARLVGRLSKRKARKVDEQVEAYLHVEKLYRAFSSHPRANNHERALTTIVAQRRGEGLVVSLDEALRDGGIEERAPWRQRLGAVGAKARELGRAARVGAASLPALARAATYLYSPFRKQRNAEEISKALRFLGKSYQVGSGMELDVQGRDRVPSDRPVIYAFSHRAELEDAIVMMSTMERSYAFLVGQWAMPGFMNDRLAREPSVINVEGKKADGRRVNAVIESVRALKRGEDLVIFPEGMTPSDHQETQPLRRGIDVIAALASRDTPVAIVPATIDDTSNRYDGLRHRSIGEKMRVKITFEEPIDPVYVRAIPGITPAFLRTLIRSLWHRNFYGPSAGGGETVDLRDLERKARFDGLHR